MNNFRVTTDYIFEILNTNDSNYYQIWVSGTDGNPTLNIASAPDETGIEIDWDYSIEQLPSPSEAEQKNYRIVSNVLQIYNVDTGKWHTLYIDYIKNNPIPSLSISRNGEK